ncbi:ADP-forming succinate--CoA ligase subunit beta [Candidatus Bipolaricaulota sp. J31]
MKLLEWQGRLLFERFGIPVPKGEVVERPADARRVAEGIGGKVVLKAQIPVGGRGKAGGIKPAASPDEAEKLAAELLEREIKGIKVERLLVVQAAEIHGEHYLGITIDRARRAPVMIYSPEGGIEIEEVAKREPEAVSREHIPPLEGPSSFRLRRLFRIAPSDLKKDLARIALKLYELFRDYEATLVEINPLAETPDGLLALDAKVIIDDDHTPDPRFAELAEDVTDPAERVAREAGFSYVRLDGDIGVIGNGAGLVMATLDLVSQAGGRPACFLDIGGGARAERVKRAVELVLEDGRVRAVFVNVFGGITRCDEVARGLVDGTAGAGVPVVVRLTGTNEEEGREILKEAGLEPVETMEEGASLVVSLVKEGR